MAGQMKEPIDKAQGTWYRVHGRWHAVHGAGNLTKNTEVRIQNEEEDRIGIVCK